MEKTLTELRTLRTDLTQLEGLENKLEEINDHIETEVLFKGNEHREKRDAKKPCNSRRNSSKIQRQQELFEKRSRNILRIVAFVFAVLIVLLSVKNIILSDVQLIEDGASIGKMDSETMIAFMLYQIVASLCLFFSTLTEDHFWKWIGAGGVFSFLGLMMRNSGYDIENSDVIVAIIFIVIVAICRIVIIIKTENMDSKRYKAWSKESSKQDNDQELYNKQTEKEVAKIENEIRQKLRGEYSDKINNLKKQISDMKTKIKTNTVLGEDDKTVEVVEFVIKRLESKRADSIKEALLQYDDDYRIRMENASRWFNEREDRRIAREREEEERERRIAYENEVKYQQKRQADELKKINDFLEGK